GRSARRYSVVDVLVCPVCTVSTCGVGSCTPLPSDELTLVVNVSPSAPVSYVTVIGRNLWFGGHSTLEFVVLTVPVPQVNGAFVFPPCETVAHAEPPKTVTAAVAAATASFRDAFIPLPLSCGL